MECQPKGQTSCLEDTTILLLAVVAIESHIHTADSVVYVIHSSFPMKQTLAQGIQLLKNYNQADSFPAIRNTCTYVHALLCPSPAAAQGMPEIHDPISTISKRRQVE